MATPDIADALRDGALAVFYLDLNGFKLLNDTEGHDAGDLALRITADRLRQSVRASDHVARLGGDEFVCLIHDAKPRQAAGHVAKRIQELTDRPIQINGQTYEVRPSIGVALADGEMTWDTILTHADTAMYVAKENRCREAVFHSDDMSRPQRQEAALNVVELRAG